MAAKMDELNEQWRVKVQASHHPFQRVSIGIGLNSGECCVGNLGSTLRFDYSAIGDEVNVTSRFEGLTKIYGLTAVAGQRALSPEFRTLEVDLVQVKGRTVPEKIYTFLQLLRADELLLERLEQKHNEFLAAYRGQHWDEADRLISRVP